MHGYLDEFVVERIPDSCGAIRNVKDRPFAVTHDLETYGNDSCLTCGVAAGLGIAGASQIWIAGAVAGIGLVMQAQPTLFLGMKAVGACYLLYLAFGLWRGAHNVGEIGEQSVALALPHRPLRAFGQGFAVQISNPKTLAYYASVFSVLIPPSWPLGLLAQMMALLFIVEFMWFTTLAVVLSTHRVKSSYARIKVVFDRVMATVLGAMGFRLLAGLRD